MRIFLDHNAGAPIRPAAREALARFIAEDRGGNPSSIHHAGQHARRMLERAREGVAALIAAPARSMIFTSGGTEANNLAIMGAARDGERHRIVTSAIEHSSMLAPVAELERRGFEVVRLPVDRNGRIDSAITARVIDRDTALVTLGLANAETGTIQSLDGVADAAAEAGAMFHLDAAQAAGRIAINVAALRCDLLSVSGHKIGAPSGIGALYVRPGAPLAPVLTGGPQEAGLRAGTPNLMGAIAFGVAAEETLRNLDEESARMAILADELMCRLDDAIPGLRLNGPHEERICNTLNLTFPGVLGESLLIALDLEGIEVSMGSACAAGAVEPSHVLTAMGLRAQDARSSLRISLGWSTTAGEIARAAEIIPRVWRRVAQAEPSVAETPR
jgi:cysteine desulfurase